MFSHIMHAFLFINSLSKGKCLGMRVFNSTRTYFWNKLNQLIYKAIMKIQWVPRFVGWNVIWLWVFPNSSIIHHNKSQQWRRFGYPVLISIDFDDFSSPFTLIFVSFEKMYQTLETVIHRLSKHLEFHQKYSSASRIFNSILGFWISRWNTVYRVWYITSNTVFLVRYIV